MSGNATELARTDLLLADAERTDTPSRSGLPTRVKFDIPFPELPRGQQAPQATRVIVVLALSLTNTYVIDAVLPYAST